MSLDSDLALFGTGIAPLIAARQLMEQGKSVIVLNPDRDFFLEDSELPLDPLSPVTAETLRPDRVRKSDPDRVLQALRPGFPGAVEFAGGKESEGGFRDPSAPYVRARTRLWLSEAGLGALEDFYVEIADAGFNPQTIEGITAASRFPGGLARDDRLRGVLLPRLADVDVQRYRNGLLEFVRERLGPERVLCGTSQLEAMPGGIRFHADGGGATARLRGGLVSFWTPRLTSWNLGLLALLKDRARGLPVPARIRLWEQWSLVSRHPVDPGVVGVIDDIAVWAEIEGSPAGHGSAPFHRLAVLRSAGEASVARWGKPQGAGGWASTESFSKLSDLFHGRFHWDYVTIRSMRPRAILEWEGDCPDPYLVEGAATRVLFVPGSDGPLHEVVATAQAAASRVEEWAG